MASIETSQKLKKEFYIHSQLCSALQMHKSAQIEGTNPHNVLF